MGKGTLQDILSDEKVTLDDMFKSSMIGDAAKVINLSSFHRSQFLRIKFLLVCLTRSTISVRIPVNLILQSHTHIPTNLAI